MSNTNKDIEIVLQNTPSRKSATTPKSAFESKGSKVSPSIGDSSDMSPSLKSSSVIPTSGTFESRDNKLNPSLGDPILPTAATTKPKFNLFNVFFSIKGLLILLAIIIVLGLVLGMIPLYHTNTRQASSETIISDQNASTASQTVTEITTTLLTCRQPEVPPVSLSDQLNSSKSSFSCPNTSPYKPSFLDISTAYSFGYLVNQQVVCMDGQTGNAGKLSITCPADRTIHIYSAYFGIQSNTPTECITSNKAGTTSDCFNKVVFDNINTTCEGKQTCSLDIRIENFGDPCFLLNKQLFIQYQCVNASISSLINSCTSSQNYGQICSKTTESNSQYWCNNDNVMRIDCGPGKVIQMSCAFYGIDQSYQCPGGFYSGAPTVCFSQTTRMNLTSLCNGQQACSVSSADWTGFFNTDFFYCYGMTKYIYAQWDCIDPNITTTEQSATTEALTTQPSTNMTTTTSYINNLPVCEVNFDPIGTCTRPDSPYVPDLNAEEYYGYPIYQQTVCSGSQINIFCPTSLVIHIYAAYYGIQHRTQLCNSLNRTEPTACYYKSAFDFIETTCEYKSYCKLETVSAGLSSSDPCPGYDYKQLFVQYQCLEIYALNTTINKCSTNTEVPLICQELQTNTTSSANTTYYEGTWCQRELMHISCASQQHIHINCAFYGIHPSLGSACNMTSIHQATGIPVCYFDRSLNTVYAECDGQQTCQLPVNSTSFGDDPCIGMTKALYVQWRCGH